MERKSNLKFTVFNKRYAFFVFLNLNRIIKQPKPMQLSGLFFNSLHFAPTNIACLKKTTRLAHKYKKNLKLLTF